MIIRLLHAKVRPGKQAEFKKVLELLSVPEVQSRSGMIAFYPGQPLGPESSEFILVTVWKDRKALASYSREDWASAIMPEEAFPLLEEWHINGYKSFGVLEPQLKPIFKIFNGPALLPDKKHPELYNSGCFLSSNTAPPIPRPLPAPGESVEE